MLNRLAWLTGLLLGGWSGDGTGAARGQAQSLLEHFADQPADALIRKLEPGPGLATTTPIDSTESRPGLVLRRKIRRLDEHNAVTIDCVLTNTNEAALTAKEVTIASLRFLIAGSEDAGRYQKLTHRQDTWYGSTYWTGPNWTRVGQDWHHPGIDTPSVRRFTAPRDGKVAITGRVYKADTNNGGGDGVRIEIRHGERTVWKGQIDGDDATGLEPNVTLAVRKGDAIRFVVHKRGWISYDTTHWDPVVTYDDGQSFLASKSFSTDRQGRGGWFYEMQVDPGDRAYLPTVHGFDADFGLRESVLEAGKPVRMSHDKGVGLFVLADGDDAGGVAIGLADADAWRFESVLSKEGRLEVALRVGHQAEGRSLEAGESVRLGRIVLGSYRSGWIKGMSRLQELRASAIQNENITALREALGRAGVPELDLWAMTQTDWRLRDKLTESVDSYSTATARQFDKARARIADLRERGGTEISAAYPEQLDRLAASTKQAGEDLDAWRSLYTRVRRLKREIILADPLMDFGGLVFCKRVPTSYSHLVMQYFGWRARAGGGLFVLENPGRSLAARDILDGKLVAGNVLEPRLSYDARRIVFSYVECEGKTYKPETLNNETDEGFYHIYEVNVDGTGLRQLTRGPYDDLMPTYLPDGGIAFSSTRRRGYARCFGGQFSRRWHTYTLHRMDADGGDIRTLSFNDVNEWFPTVSNDGLLLYSRWDYIDRDAVTHQNLWSTRPDGTNPIALWGNATSSPHCSFQMQPIPGSSKIVFTASAHHSVTAGSIAVVDPNRGHDGHEAITRITPEVPFPEAEGRDIREYYAAPWALSEKHFLVAYSPRPLVWEPGANLPDALGIYYLDAAGNRELIYRDPDIGSTNPCPLTARPVPPVLASQIAVDGPPTGEMVVIDVYEGLGDIPRGHIKELRIIQIFPKSTNVANTPPIGLAREENGRAVLGTVPVRPDGSAYFTVPARKPILFQALDENGFAYQTMRSLTYVQPGERIACIGCHENRTQVPPKGYTLSGPPSKIRPGPFDGRPFSYVRVVQPVLDKHCTSCHGRERPDGGLDLTGAPHKGFTKSYWSLCGDKDFWADGTNPANAAEALVPRFGGRNQIQVTPPGGTYGALGSRLVRILRAGHYDVKLSDQAMRRLATWIDCNAIFYGVNQPEAQARQLAGEVVPMPEVQ